MAKTAQTFQVKIENILGGHAPSMHFTGQSQFITSIAIDPAQPIDDNSTVYSTIASGLIRPIGSVKLGGATIAQVPMWLVPNPKNSLMYVYGGAGSAYSVDLSGTPLSVTAISDGGTLSSSTGNGCAYYDNYIYFAKNTDIARYGPLNGVVAFDGAFWVTTLGKTALVNTSYPRLVSISRAFPNHILHRHSDGKLYIADVVSNKGTIHYIQTKNVAAEGDTDDGSTYNKLQVGYGLWPIAMESYGSDLAIAFFEGNVSGDVSTSLKAKIAFWDTTSANVNKIIWVEFPDRFISAMKNINGILYVVSGNGGSSGFRISRFVGGYTFEEIEYFEDGGAPLPGAIDGNAKRLLFGARVNVPETHSAVFSYGLQKASLGQGLFNVMAASGGSTVTITSLSLPGITSFTFNTPLIGWSDGLAAATRGIDTQQNATYGSPAEIWWSQMWRIGHPFKITKIRIPLAQAIAANMVITPTIYFDDATTTNVLTEINNTNFPGNKNIVLRPNGATGQNNFWLGLRWSGSVLAVVGLPITIEYELIDD